MPVHNGRTEIREGLTQLDGEQEFDVGDDIEIFLIIPMFSTQPQNQVSGTLSIYIKTCTVSEWEPLVSPYTQMIEQIDLSSPRSVQSTVWAEHIKIVPTDVVGTYDIMIKKGYR